MMNLGLPPIRPSGFSMQNENPFQRGYNDAEDSRLEGIQPINELADDGPGFGFNDSPVKNDGSGFSPQGYNQNQRLLGDDSNSRMGIGVVSQHPTRTAGQITLKDLQSDDISKEPYLSRDAAVLIEAELRQFETKRMQPTSQGGVLTIQRYVESLVTGNFWQVQSDVSPNASMDTGKKEEVQSSRENYEREMKQIQRLWVNRIHKLFYMFLGLLAGMSLMHLVVIMNGSPDKGEFLNVYSPISKDINIVFMIFTSFALIFGICLTMIYKNKSDEKMRVMDPFRMEFRQHYILSMLISIIIAVSLGLLYIIPHFVNKFYYYSPINISDSDISTCKGLFGAVNVLLLLSWVLASALNKASISDMDMDPEDFAREDGASRDSEAEELTQASARGDQR